ncbi:hypothetical protein ADL27_47270, partial [Streptomyces sp. NRRL F-6602]
MLRRLADETPGEVQRAECGCDPAPLHMADGTYSHWAGCPIADAEQQAAETPADRDAEVEELRATVAQLRAELGKERWARSEGHEGDARLRAEVGFLRSEHPDRAAVLT